MATVKIFALASLLLVLVQGASAEWKPAKSPLMTRWAKDVSPDRAHPEYPRPQMVRKEWLNLNGLWQYALAEEGQDPPVGKDLAGEILVPFPIESALSGVGKRAERLWYRRMFTVPDGWKGRGQGQKVLLHFGAVDWEATVYVNGKKLGSHRGGYDAFSFDITGALNPGKANELIVGVFDPTSRGTQPRGKQVEKPGGIWYTPTTGIWQTVWLEPVAETYIRRLVLRPDVDAKCLRLVAEVAGPTEGRGIKPTGGPTDALTVQATAYEGGRQVGRSAGGAGDEVPLRLVRPKLWSPSSPHLYDLKVELKGFGKTIDSVSSYFGMRKIAIGKDPQGVMRILLNGKFVFQIGFLDQGFWPDGLYAAPTDEALRYDIEVTRKLGFNMARKHVKIEPARWYYWCDKLGLLVWQDMPSGNTTKDRKQFKQELTRLVQGMGNHPSIIMWVVFNEGWGQMRKDPKDTKLLVDLVRKLDPSRLISNASGWADHGVGDIIDVHRYPGPAAPKPDPKRAGVLGEFGGLGLPLADHLWQARKSWGYRKMGDRDQLTARYVDLLRKVYRLKDTHGLSAGVYTQTTDVEIEVNGLMTYDRAIIKPDVEKVAAANRGEFPPPPIIKQVVPTSENKGIKWRYTTEDPGKGWYGAGFDDTSWKTGPGGFGRKDTPGAVVRTKWETSDIWIRREFELKDTAFTDLQLRIHHDEDAQVYVNGVRAVSRKDYTGEYIEVPLSEKARAALKKGTNVFAVHCKQTRGGQYIDVGLVDVIPPPKEKNQ